MECPKCKGEEVEIGKGYVMPDAMDAELYCEDCGEIVAFYRIKNEQWIEQTP